MTSLAKTNLIKSSVNNGRIALAVKLIVLDVACNGGVHIGNVQGMASDFGISKAQVAGALAALTNEGFYTPSDDPEYKGQYGYIDATK